MDFKAQIDELGLSGRIFTKEGRTLFHGQDLKVVDHGPGHPDLRYVAVLVEEAVVFLGRGNTIKEALDRATPSPPTGGDIGKFPLRNCLMQFSALLGERGFDSTSNPVGWSLEEGVHPYYFGPRNGKGRYQVEVFQDHSWQVITCRNGGLWRGAGNSLDDALEDLSPVPNRGQGVIGRLLAKFGII